MGVSRRCRSAKSPQETTGSHHVPTTANDPPELRRVARPVNVAHLDRHVSMAAGKDTVEISLVVELSPAPPPPRAPSCVRSHAVLRPRCGGSVSTSTSAPMLVPICHDG
jgi:hypothetical protein